MKIKKEKQEMEWIWDLNKLFVQLLPLSRGDVRCHFLEGVGIPR